MQFANYLRASAGQWKNCCLKSFVSWVRSRESKQPQANCFETPDGLIASRFDTPDGLFARQKDWRLTTKVRPQSKQEASC